MCVRQWVIVAMASWLAIGPIVKGDEVIEAGKNNPENNASIYHEATSTAKTPIRLRPGPHLFLDDYLVGKIENVKRRVNCPVRDPQIPNPLITGREDECVAPYMTVIRDPQTKRFRIWYNVYKVRDKDHTAYVATMESADGIHWIRPHRTLKEISPIAFGVSVIDEGPDFRDLTQRYKLAWFGEGGMQIAVSPNGLEWTKLKQGPVLRHNHDILNIFRDPLRNRYFATVSVYTTGPTWSGKRRVPMQGTSPDLIHWENPWYVVTPDDGKDPGETQFYAMCGYLFHGPLCIGLVKVLHDDWKAPGTAKDAYGVGYTALCWSRDGRHWVRDQAPFFEPDPKTDAWDHAHAWLDIQVPIGDEVRIYYGGYKSGHKSNIPDGRQIGMVRMLRDRYVSREADAKGGTLLTPPVILQSGKMTVNACVRGEMRVRLLNDRGEPIPGFDAADGKPIQGDGVAMPVVWKGSFNTMKDKPVRIEFQMKDAQLYGFDLHTK